MGSRRRDSIRRRASASRLKGRQEAATPGPLAKVPPPKSDEVLSWLQETASILACAARCLDEIGKAGRSVRSLDVARRAAMAAVQWAAQELCVSASRHGDGEHRP